MADESQADVERVATPDNDNPAPDTSNQPAQEAEPSASPPREEIVPDPPAEGEEQLNKNQVRIRLVFLDGSDTIITCQVGASLCILLKFGT